MNCNTAPLRKSKLGQKRFWYTVPEVIEPSATSAAAMLVSDSPSSDMRRCNTSATPSKPSSRPAHCRRLRRSPRMGAAAKAVRMGCSPHTSAITPADMPA